MPEYYLEEVPDNSEYYLEPVEEEPSTFDRVKDFGLGLAHTARAVAETGAGLATGLAAFPISKGTKWIEYALSGGDLEKARAAEQLANERIQFQPTLPESKGALETLGKYVFDPIFGTLKEMGQLPGESWKSETMREIGGDIAEIGGPVVAGMAVKGLRGAKEYVREAGKEKIKEPESIAPEPILEPREVKQTGKVKPIEAGNYILEPVESNASDMTQPFERPEMDLGVPKETPVGELKAKGNLTPTEDWTASLAKEQRASEQRGSIGGEKASERKPFTFEPEIEKEYSKSVPRKETFFERSRTAASEMWHKVTREYENLPRTKENAEAIFALKQLEKQKGVASEKANLDIGGVLSGIKDKDSYDVFTRKVILDDLAREAEMSRDLPWGFTKESLANEKAKLDAHASSNPKVQEALSKRKQVWDDLKSEYTDAMSEIGMDVSGRFKNESYFRHQVLEYINLNGLYGTGKKLKTPSNRGFLKKREGSSLDINRDYLQPEHEVMSQMRYDIEVAKTIKRIKENYDISDKIKAEAKAKGVDDWHRSIPETHRAWQPREGNVFYMADSIPANVAEMLQNGMLEELFGLDRVAVQKVMAVGGKRKELVIPNELADTLDNLTRQRTKNVIANADREIHKAWKIWQLISPRRYIKYNIRNLTGDADASFVGNPSGFKMAPKAAKEIYDVIVEKKPMSPEFQDWYDRGGMELTLQAQEFGELKNLWTVKRLYDKNKSITDIPKDVWGKYWKTAKVSTDMRESVLRYANYLDYLEQMKTNGKPKNFGASIPEEIMGLKDIKDRAFWLSNDLLGAYDRVGVMGQNLREFWYPFWSWKEVNFKRYIQFAKNAAENGEVASLVGKKALSSVAKSPYTAYKVGKFLVKATAFWSALQVWNHTQFPDEEKSLPESERTRPHIILGKDDNGKVLNFTRIGALGDFLQWFGLDAAPHYVDAWFKGKMTLPEIAKDMAKSPVNVVVSGGTPLVKLPGELATRQSTFPDVFNPGVIRDKGMYLARSFGLENEYAALTGKPSEGYGKSLQKGVIYETDPGQSAYGDVYDMKRRFQEKSGKGAEGFWLTPKGDALYDYKLAVRYSDKKAAEKALMKYASLGGTSQGVLKSLSSMHPLFGLNAQDKTAFIASLKPDDKERLNRAIQFYNTVLLGRRARQ